MENSSKLNYFGKVSLKIKIKDKLITFKSNNTGTENLFVSLANYLVGNVSVNSNLVSIPECIDLKFSSSSGDYSSATTCLKVEASIPITRKDMDKTNSGGVPHTSVLFEATVTSNALDIPQGNNNKYYICLCDKNKYTLAYLPFSNEYMNIIKQPGTQAIITWETEINNYSSPST